MISGSMGFKVVRRVFQLKKNGGVQLEVTIHISARSGWEGEGWWLSAVTEEEYWSSRDTSMFIPAYTVRSNWLRG